MQHHALDPTASYYNNGGCLPQQLAGINPPPLHSADDYETFTPKESQSPPPAPAPGPSFHCHVLFRPDLSTMTISSDHLSNTCQPPPHMLDYRDVIEQELWDDELILCTLEEEFALAANHNEPNTYKQNMKTSKAPSWQIAMQDKLYA